jgi:hypothetical protein
VLGAAVGQKGVDHVTHGHPAEGPVFDFRVGHVLLEGQLLNELRLGEFSAGGIFCRSNELDLPVGSALFDRGVPPPGLLAVPDLLHDETPGRKKPR